MPREVVVGGNPAQQRGTATWERFHPGGNMYGMHGPTGPPRILDGPPHRTTGLTASSTSSSSDDSRATCRGDATSSKSAGTAHVMSGALSSTWAPPRRIKKILRDPDWSPPEEREFQPGMYAARSVVVRSGNGIREITGHFPIVERPGEEEEVFLEPDAERGYRFFSWCYHENDYRWKLRLAEPNDWTLSEKARQDCDGYYAQRAKHSKDQTPLVVALLRKCSDGTAEVTGILHGHDKSKWRGRNYWEATNSGLILW